MKVVVVSPHPVQPANSGDRVRTAQLLDGLGRRGIDAQLVAWTWSRDDRSSPWPSSFAAGKPLTPFRWLVWRTRFNYRRRTDPWAEYTIAHASASLADLARDLDPDIIDFQHSYTWEPTGILDVCTFHNVESDLVASTTAAGAKGTELIRERERRVLRNARAVVVFSDVDAERARSIEPTAHIDVVALGHEPEGEPKTSHATALRTGVFVGTLSYEPNARAVAALVEQWPALRAAGLERLWIVGRDADQVVSARDGIEVFANVESVVPYLTSADVTLVPLAAGGGVRVKLIEAFALGVPVVTTEIGAEGLEVTDGEEAVVVPGVAELPAALTRLQAPDVRAGLARRARALWEARYSPDTMIEAMIRVYEAVLAAG